jgi:Fibronectin type III domain
VKRGIAALALIFSLTVVTSAPASAASLIVEWDPPTDGVTVGYVLWGGLASGNYTHSIDVGAVTRFHVVGLPEGATFYFAVQAYNASGERSPLSQEVIGTPSASTTCRQPPRPPQLTVDVFGSSIRLSWSPSGADPTTGFVLDVGSAPGQTNIASARLPAAMTSVTGEAPSGIYFVRIAGVNACGVSEPSPELTVATGKFASHAPSAPLRLTSRVSGHEVVLAWSAPARGGALSRYMIDVFNTQGQLFISFDTGSSSTTFSHRDTPAGEYVVRVRAVNLAGVGVVSNAVTIVIGP